MESLYTLNAYKERTHDSIKFEDLEVGKYKLSNKLTEANFIRGAQVSSHESAYLYRLLECFDIQIGIL